MAFSRRRSTEFTAYADAEDIHILVAGREQPLCAHFSVLRQFSSCVRDLPRNEDGPVVWDLQQLVLEDESSPVSAEVVQLWLDAVYCRVDAARRAPQVEDLDDARPLLIFADACGSSQVVIDEIGRCLLDSPDLTFTVTAEGGQLQPEEEEEDEDEQPDEQQQPEQPLSVKLLLRNAVYYIHPTQKNLCIMKEGLQSRLAVAEDFTPHAAAFPSAVCSALESWLHLAGRLRMVPLCRALMDFIKTQVVVSTASVLWPAFHSIYSRRVLDCMPRELLLEALVRDSLQDRPAAVKVETKGATVTLSGPAAAAFFQKHAGTVEHMDLENKLLSGFGTSIPIHSVVGGIPLEIAPALVKHIVTSAMTEPRDAKA